MNMTEFETNLLNKNIKCIAGVDEAGRGPIAGPVVAAAVILNNSKTYNYLNDSKQLTKKQRDYAFAKLKEEAIAISYQIVDHEEIDKINILEATKQAMIRSIYNLNIKPEHVLIDAVKLNIDIDSTPIIKGDQKSQSIAAASIVAKVIRDEIMDKYHELYPNYDFINNKGYLTQKHRDAVNKFGPCPIHRKTFEPIKSIVSR